MVPGFVTASAVLGRHVYLTADAVGGPIPPDAFGESYLNYYFAVSGGIPRTVVPLLVDINLATGASNTNASSRVDFMVWSTIDA